MHSVKINRLKITSITEKEKSLAVQYARATPLVSMERRSRQNFRGSQAHNLDTTNPGGT
jgi:hypothetical protein